MGKRQQLHRHSLPLLVLSAGVVVVTAIALANLSVTANNGNQVLRALTGRLAPGVSNGQADNSVSPGTGMGQLSQVGQIAVKQANYDTK